MMKRIIDFMRKNQFELFAKDGYDVGAIEGEYFYIKQKPGSEPCFSKPYVHSYEDTKYINEYIDKMLDAGWIQPSDSPYAAPMIIVKSYDDKSVTAKYDENGKPIMKIKKRPCIDYRALNKTVIPDKYPLPKIEDLSRDFKGVKIFSQLDIRTAYHHVQVAPWKIVIKQDLLQKEDYMVGTMSFGHINAVAFFPGLTAKKFRHCKDYLKNLLDDFVIHTREPISQHEIRLLKY